MSDSGKRADAPSGTDMKGWLAKWTNYLKGYQKRWFVLHDGLLSYYRNQAEMSHTCRGTISLVSAVIHTEDSCNFVISNGGTQTFHLKAGNEVERQKWVTALELAKSHSIRRQEAEEDEERGLGLDQVSPKAAQDEQEKLLRCLAAKRDDLKTCNDLVTKHSYALMRCLGDLEQSELSEGDAAVRKIMKQVNERATLFRITSTNIVKTSVEFVEMAQGLYHQWSRLLEHEHSQRLKLEEQLEQLARQHSHLEKAAKEAVSSGGWANYTTGSEGDEDEFFDAPEENEGRHDFVLSLPNPLQSSSGGMGQSSMGKGSAGKASDGGSQGPGTDASRGPGLRRSGSAASEGNEMSGASSDESEGSPQFAEANVVRRKRTTGKDTLAGASIDPKNQVKDASEAEELEEAGDEVPIGALVASGGRQRRKHIPEKPNCSISLWSIMKNCIGKELTKIPMPVHFNEPLSTLQRLAEDYEYSALLDKAARSSDPQQQLVYVACFAISSYSTTANRTGKPFNPLLGETYECDRQADLGWRLISEQVSHHPPMLAQYAEGRGWRVWQEFTMSSKFRGKYLQVTPLGIVHLEFPEKGYHLTWKKVTTTVHNIIVGKLWVDHHGDMEIINHSTNDRCHVKFQPYSYFSRDSERKVTGVVTDAQGAAHWILQGKWDSKIEALRVVNTADARNVAAGGGKSVLETATPKVIWKRVLPPTEYEKMYNFTVLACQLNEPEENIAPTDSRLRPDQRLMEEGNLDEANNVKVQLEEKQRQVRRQREAEAEVAAREGRPYPPYEPVWFKKDKDPITGNPIHIYQGDYWTAKEGQTWNRCPDIYLS